VANRKDGLIPYEPKDHNNRRIRELVDLASQLNGIGNLSQAYTNALMGFDHRFAGIPIPVNTESRGMVFFTRPRMNLSYDNLVSDRRMSALITRDEMSIGRAIRVLLDPRRDRDGPAGENIYEDDGEPIISRLVDSKSPFIPILSNTLISLSGWPDTMTEFFSSTAGIAKESYFYIDGPHRNFSEFTLTASFRNIPGDPITFLLQMWHTYATNVYRGSMIPYPEAVIEREIDYQTRIYHFVMDPSRRFIQKSAVACVAIPESAGIASAFNFSSDSVYSQESLRQISVPFHCAGVEYNDPINLDEFNRLQAHFNPELAKRSDRLSKYVKLNPDEISAFNYYGYPHINLTTNELEWWIPKKHYKLMKGEPLVARVDVGPAVDVDTGEVLAGGSSSSTIISDEPDNGPEGYRAFEREIWDRQENIPVIEQQTLPTKEAVKDFVSELRGQKPPQSALKQEVKKVGDALKSIRDAFRR